MPEEPPQVSPEDVLNYIRTGQGPEGPKRPGDMFADPADAQEKVPEFEVPLANTEFSEADVDLPTRKEIPDDLRMSHQSPSVHQTVTWEKTPNDLERRVEISEEEKSLFFKSGMLDIRFEIDVMVNSVPIRIQSVSEYEEDVIFSAVHKDMSEGIITTFEQRVTRVQWYMATLQVTRFNNQTVEHLKLPEGEDDVSKHADMVREWHKSHSRHRNVARWLMTLLACRIFAVKLNMLNNALANDDFPKPGDIA